MLGALYHPRKMDRRLLEALTHHGVTPFPMDYGTEYANEAEANNIVDRNPILQDIMDAADDGLCHGKFDKWAIYEESMMSQCTLYSFNEDMITAFASLQVAEYDEGPMLELLMFCSNQQAPKGSGSRLLRLLQDLAQAMDLVGIVLESVESAVGFYVRHGFAVDYTDHVRLSHMTWLTS